MPMPQSTDRLSLLDKPNNMDWYTVVGLWDDTGQVYTCSFYASDAHAAMKMAANMDRESADGTRLEWAAPDQILGAYLLFPSTPDGADIPSTFCCACEDTGKAAYSEDLRGEE